MKFTVLTLFPEMLEQALRTSILGRAMEKNLIELRAVNIRDYTVEKHGRVDDYTYGGGAGMLMQAQPVYDAWCAATEGKKVCRTVYVTPQGRPFTQRMAAELAREEELVILCGHYEGIDDRVLKTVVTDYVSIGDYVLTGGELPAMVMIDAIARLVPGVLHNDESAETESFHRDLLEYPQYSRPEEWNGMRVPEVLLSGDHRRVEAWRLGEAMRITRERRPELYQRYQEKEALIRRLSSNKRHNIHLMESLKRGRAEIVYQNGENLLLHDAEAEVYLICGCEEADTTARQEPEKGWRQLVERLAAERNPIHVIASQSYWLPLLEKCFGVFIVTEYRQACYTQQNPLPVKHKDIRPHSDGFYGIYADGTLVGRMGYHSAGNLGMLRIDEAYRGQGYGAALESYLINRRLEQGMTPYVWVPAGDVSMAALQEQLGLYWSRESVWELRKERNE